MKYLHPLRAATASPSPLTRDNPCNMVHLRLEYLLALFWLLVVAFAPSASATAEWKKPAPNATLAEDRRRERNQQIRYTASWAVEISEGGDKMADYIARKHGYRNLGKVGFADQQYTRPVYKRSYRVPIDPRFRQQWYLLNTGRHGTRYSGRDLNIEKVWMQGLTGCNITIGVVDDGFEYVHPDLRDNYAPTVSYDFVEGDTDPAGDMYDWHGTRCAGLVSAAKDGAACGVGVAYNSKFGGLRLLGAFTDLNEASSLTYANEVIDIYSNSWGPCDEGCVDGPLRLTHLALKTGSERGRDGKGSIFVWANGNGGSEDDCAADGYSSSIYTISVGAVGVAGEQSWYDEECSAKMVTAYVTDDRGYSDVSTTATDELCVSGFGGTSASCPMVAGAIALTLEANANLTYRDIMYLVVFTSDASLTAGGSYTTNAAGQRFSPKFGFGILDAEAMVARGRNWINVPPLIEDIRIPSTTAGRATSSRPVVIYQTYSGSITYLEHVVVNVTLDPVGRDDPQRGHISLEIRSPSRTRSSLLKYRTIDDTNRDYYRWPFMSVAFWGENPSGTWQLTIRSRSSLTNADYSHLRFQFYGAARTPESVARIPSRCHSACARGCAAPGAQYCDACANLRNAYTLECITRCPTGYTQRNGYCYDVSQPEPVCNSKILSLTAGLCEVAGYSEGCCTEGKCEGTIPSSPFGLCHCDKICHNLNDCCKDIDLINCTRKELEVSPLHFLSLRSNAAVTTLTVPITDDGASPVIRIPLPLPLGASVHSTVYVGTNGYFSFDKVFTAYSPFEFPGENPISLVAPFFSDVDISKGQGSIKYEVHRYARSPAIFTTLNTIINREMGSTNFAGTWLLLAEWKNVPEFGRSHRFTNTFQGVVVTDFTDSYAVFIYKCQDMGFSGSATIGFTSLDNRLFANHRISGYRAKNVACLNSGQSDWVNLVYKLTRDDLQAIGPDVLHNECEIDAHNCEQECIDLPVDFVCSCYDGYALQRNGIHCFPYCHAEFTEEVGEFNSPSWPGSYPQSFWCEWRVNLTATLQNYTSHYFIVFSIDSSAYGMESNCSEEYVQFFDGLGVNATSLGKFCGTRVPPPVPASGLEARVVFVASDEHPDNLRGVRVTYSLATRENECEENNGGCQHICRDSTYSYSCECRAGYRLTSNGRTCQDVDECQGSHPCDQTCTNTQGSYECSCETGFALQPNSRTCLPSCTETFTSLSGSFQTPGWPISYPRLDFTCLWTVNLTEESIGLRFSVDNSAYGILGRPPCRTEYLEFHDGLTTGATSLGGRFCYLIIPDDVTTSSGQALVVFKSSASYRPTSRRGVRVTYQTFALVNECLTNNGGCDQICEDTSQSFTCSCTNGYTLDTDGLNCNDVDECSTGTDDCQQLCINTNGSYVCDCREGFVLNSDNQTCRIFCNGNFTASSGSFQTPGWPTYYPLNFRCQWNINPLNTTSNHILSLTVNSRYGIHGRGSCPTDYVRFYDGNSTSAALLGSYCFLNPPDTIYTSSSQAMVIFQASTIPHLRSRVGVRVTYQLHAIENECDEDNGGCEGTCMNTRTSFFCQCGLGYSLSSDARSCEDVDECSTGTDDCQQLCINTNGSYVCDCREGFVLNSDNQTCRIFCDGNFTTSSGSFQTPGWPTYYPLNFRCQWNINPLNTTSNHILSLSVDSRYGIHGRSSCPTDYLSFYDGSSLTDRTRSMGVYCGLSTPSALYASSGQAVVVFQSSNSRQSSNRPGVRITYQLFELVNECEEGNGGCEGVCVNTLTSFECHCDEGYVLASDGLHCDDVNECEGSHRTYCDGPCINTNGSFYCTCSEDFTLGSNGRSCYPVCGGNITSDFGSITSPGWPGSYPSISFSCIWTLSSSRNNSIIDFSFVESFGIVGAQPCPSDYVEILDGPNTASSSSLGRFCSLQMPDSVFTSSNVATVIFRASSGPFRSPQHVGFNVTFTAITKVNECEDNNGGCEQLCEDLPRSFNCLCNPGYTLASNRINCTDVNECSSTTHGCSERCINTIGSFYCGCNNPDFVIGEDGQTCVPDCGGTLTDLTGTFSTPGWPRFYHSLNYRCTWIILIDNLTNSSLDISFNTPFGIHGRHPCPTDYVEVFDGVGEGAVSQGRFCFLDLPPVISTLSTNATVVFQASTARHTPSRVGISVTYTTLRLGVNECMENNGGCDHICMNTRRSFTCSCRDGYSLASDDRGCTDNDECLSSNHGCEHQCSNTPGSYICLCNEGYALGTDRRSCSLDCGGTLPSHNGSFASPGWPRSYPQLNFRCVWTLSDIPTGNSVAFVIDKSAFGIHSSSQCVSDYLEFFNAVGFSGSSVGRYCSLDAPGPVIIASGGVRIVFQGRVNQNRGPEYVGVKVNYTILENECAVNNGGCNHTCTDTIFSYDCECHPGYKLTSDNHTCQDEDECTSGTHECAQTCHNSIGLYSCSCGEEFKLAPDGKTCLPVCGGTFTEPNGTLNTPGWPTFYPELDFRCEWSINVSGIYLQNGTKLGIKLSFNETHFGLGYSSNCNRDYIKVYSGIGDDAEAVKKVCGSEVPASFTITSSEVKVEFRGSSLPHLPSQVGAMLYYYTVEQEFGDAPCGNNEILDFSGNCREVECGGMVYSMTGVLRSPNWPDRYTSDALCEWTLVLPDPDAIVRLTIDEIHIARNRYGLCFWDYLIVFQTSDGQGRIPPLLSGGRLCGNTPPAASMVSTGNMIHVWYQSRNTNNRGFSISYSAIFV